MDAEDADLVNEYTWHLHFSKKQYARTKSALRRTLMHRLILGVSDIPSVQVDHVNGDTLDNRRANLRLCSAADNARNRKPGANNSGFLGVECLPSGRFRARVRGVPNIGTFGTAEEAARARDWWAKKTHGEFAVLNFPEGV